MKDHKKVLFSSGFNKSHIIAIASQLNKYSFYKIYLISSFYPKSRLRRVLKYLSPLSRSIYRLIDRSEDLDEKNVYSNIISEFLCKLSLIFKNKNDNLKLKIENLGIKIYTNSSINILKKVKPNIYHYRCAYGSDSLDYAKKRKIITICDHTICHPRFLWTQLYLNNTVKDPFQLKKLNNIEALSMNDHFKLMEHDLNIAENILTDCDLVKKTCVFYGLDPDKINVIYRGCDDKFLSYIESFKKNRKKRNELFFAGSWTKRKGVMELSKALIDLNQDITLNIAGASYADIKNLTPYIFNSKVKLNIYGYLNRNELAQIYSDHNIFIMPSLAEGSARVGFEALACGCFVITTPFSGTIVKDNINGFIIDAGNVNQLKIAIQKALEIPKKDMEHIMFNNYSLIRNEFTAKKYIKKLHEYYEFLETKT